MRQDLLRQHGQRHRTDMAAGLRTLDHQRIDAGTHQPPGQHHRRREGDQPGAAILHRAHRATGWNAAGQHDMADLRLQAHPDQIVQLRMHGDQIDPERPAGQRLRGGDFLLQQFRAHRAAGDHAEAAGIRQRGHQMPLAHPAHRTAKDRDLAAQELGAARPQPVELRSGGDARRIGMQNIRRHRGHKRYAARARPVPCNRLRSAH